jgi:hypothetical protein
MNIEEQWQQDVSDYGDNAYLMWNTPYSEKDGNPNEKTLQVLKLHGDDLLKRSCSAELPFDLERAKAGDIVEWKDGKGNWAVVPQSELYLFHGIEHKLRMKYPQKVIK